MKKFLTALLASSLLLTACTGGGKETVKKDIDLSSYPIETDVTLTYFRALSASISTLVENYAETDFAKELSKRTGVNVEYLHPSAGNTSESINLMIASNELPDIIENNWVTSYPGGAVKAMNERVIVDIGQYKEYAPALFKIFADNPEYDKASKTDEGQYYGFPLIMGSPRLCISNGPAVRMDWVRELGLEAPETIEDWEIMLTAFKEKKGAAAPLSLNSGGISQLKGDKKYIDFGWGGAAGAFLAIDMQNAISIYFGAHILASPAQGLRSMLYRFVRAELFDDSEFEGIYKDLKDLHNYSLTY